MKNLLLLFLFLVSTVGTVNSQTELLSNGSFETGDTTSWIVSAVNGIDNGPTSCVENWRVEANSFDVCGFVTDISPTDGSFAAFTSFDGTIEDTQWIMEQTVAIPLTVSAANISFDFTAEFDFSLGPLPTIPRKLIIDLYDTGGTLIGNVFNDSFLSTAILSVNYSQNVDVLAMLSGLEGTNVVLRFTALIPEVATGPGKALIDKMSFLIDESLSISENNFNTQLGVFPNPSSGVFNITYGGNEPLLGAKIFDINGRLVYTVDLSEMRNDMQIKTPLTGGIYILEISSTSKKATKKLIVR